MAKTVFDADKTIFTNGSDTLLLGNSWKYTPSRTCCFTGHRPNKLPAKGTWLYRNILDGVKFYTRTLVFSGYDTFITGMAIGFDLIAADELLHDPMIKDKVNIVCAVPFYSQLDGSYTTAERELYLETIRKADTVAINCERRTEGCYKIRNQFMVNYSSALICYVRNDGAVRSGSAQTVRMAQKTGLEIYSVNEEEEYVLQMIERKGNS